LSFTKFCLVMTGVGFVLAFMLWLGYEQGRKDSVDLSQLEQEVNELQTKADALNSVKELNDGKGPVVVFEDFSGCSLDIDREKIARWLKERDFKRELRIYVIPSGIPAGSILAAGTFSPTSYGARIVLEGSGSFLTPEAFGENVDHELGHLDQWLEVGDQGFRELASEEKEGYANDYALNNELGFVLADVPTLEATVEGQRHGQIEYRLDGGIERLFVLNEEKPESETVIMNGQLVDADPWTPEGWYLVSWHQIPSLITYRGKCAVIWGS